MSRILKQWPGKAKYSRYNWEKYADGKMHELIAGHDYQPSSENSINNARMSAYTWGKRNGFKVRATATDQGIAVQFTLHGE